MSPTCSRRALRSLAALLPLVVACAGNGGQPPRDRALVGGTVISAPGAAPIDDAVVLVRGGRIEAVGPKDTIAIEDGVEVLDCRGATLLAGFWNSHVHFTPLRLAGAGWLPAWSSASAIHALLTRWGFVYALDTGSFPGNVRRLRDRIAAGKVQGPTLRFASGSFVAPGGSPFYISPMSLPELASPEDARAQVQEVLEGGADGIKIFSGGLAEPGRVVVMDAETVRAVVETAHARGAFVVSHPSDSAGARAAAEAGVDILAHTFPVEADGPWDRAVLRLMHAQGMALVPTLKLWHYDVPDPETSRAFIRAGQEQVRAYLDLGGQVLFGTDAGYMDDYDPSDEYAYLEGAGLSFDEVLATLTTAPAARFGAEGRTGRVATGLDADLVIVEGDPRADVRDLARVRYALHRGRLLHPR